MGLTMVSVMRSISCLSLVLCCLKGLCLDRREDTETDGDTLDCGLLGKKGGRTGGEGAKRMGGVQDKKKKEE